MKKFTFLTIFLLLPTAAWANSTICKLEESLFNAKAIAWDSVTLEAKITDSLDQNHSGKVRLEREHNCKRPVIPS